MIFKLYNGAVIFILILFLSSPLLASEKYLWPLKIQPELTSKFCDYRGGHFHGGLDIRTEGRTGLPCYAIDDSYVYRVTTSFRGFGKALYLRLKDGRIAVYGHLSDFGLGIDDRILKGQLKDKKFDQDLYFMAGEFPVKKGQQVALSGASGGSAPHLHLEIRSSANNPLNPLEYGYNLKDNSNPQFDKLAIRYYQKGYSPADPCEIEILKVVANKASSQYSIPDTIVSDNYLALAVSGGDRSGTGFLYGFYALKLFLDDSLIFQMVSDSLSFNTTRELTYVRDLELIQMFADQKKVDNDENIFYRLYVPPHADQFFWDKFNDNAGIMPPDSIPGHIRTVRIIGFDEAGNQAKLSVYIKSPVINWPFYGFYKLGANKETIHFSTPAKPNDVELQYRKSSRDDFVALKNSLSSKMANFDNHSYTNEYVFDNPQRNGEYRFRYSNKIGEISGWTYFSNQGKYGQAEFNGSPTLLKVKYGSALIPKWIHLRIENQSLKKDEYQLLNSDTDVIAEGPQNYVAYMNLGGLSGTTNFKFDNGDSVICDTTLILSPVYPDKATEAISSDSTLTIDFNIGSAYYPAYIFPSNATPTIIFGNRAFIYDLEPALLQAHAQIKFKFDAGKLGLLGKKMGIYAQSISGTGWIFIGKIDGGKLETNGFGLGELALIEDNDPPIITMIAPTGAIKSSMPTLSCVIKDGVSGLALDSGITMTIDDAWVPADYDLNTDRFAYKVRTPLVAGKHKLEINALDNQGNSITKISYFSVIKAK